MSKLKARIEYKLRGTDLFLRAEHMGDKWSCFASPGDSLENEYIMGLVAGVVLMSGWEVSDVVEVA
jgi:hypothetical protein